MFISMPLLHQHPPPQQRGLVGLAVTIAVHTRVLLKSQRRRLFLLVALVLLSLSLFLLPQTTSRLFEAEGRVPEGAATWVDGAAVVQAGPRARRGQEPRPQFEHDTARLHFDNLHRTWGELDEGGDDGGLATTTGATGPVFNSNYSNVTVWLYTRAIRTRKNWQSVLHDLMGDMPVPVKMVMVPKPEDFPRALDIPGFHIFAVMKTFVPELKESVLDKYPKGRQCGLWIIENEENQLNTTEISSDTVSVIIHPYFFTGPFAIDPRLVWMPIGSYYDRLIGGEHNLVPASQRPFLCWFAGSAKKKADGAHRQKFFDAFIDTVYSFERLIDDDDDDSSSSSSSSSDATVAVINGGDGVTYRFVRRKHFENKPDNICQVDVTAGFTAGLQGNAYALRLMDIAFALCPGGVSVETLRVYEALENGAIPVMVQADYDFGNFAFTHPHNQFLIVPSWNETNAILASWQDPARRLDLDLLQRRNVQWYRRFKDAVALHFRTFLMDRIFNSTYVPLYASQ